MPPMHWGLERGPVSAILFLAERYGNTCRLGAVAATGYANSRQDHNSVVQY